MKLFKRIFYFLLIANFFFVGCKKVDVNFGNEFIDNGNTNIYKIDSFAVDMSTVVLDSFATNGQSSISVGYINDLYFGKINTSCYSQVVLANYENIYANAMFDSICLILKPNTNYYGDTTKPLNIRVQEVTQDIKLDGEGFFLYNTKSFSVNTTPLANGNYLINPLKLNNEVNVRLNDALGIQWLNKLKANPSDTAMRDPNEFIKFFKGIKISSNGTDNLIAGFSDNFAIRLYYKKPDITLLDRFVDFTPINKQLQFQNTSIDRNSTVLQGVGGSNNEILSTQTNNVALSQKASGVMTKIKFSNIRDLLKINGFAKIVKANLTLRPVHTTYNPQFYLPSATKLASTNNLNEVGPELAFINQDGSFSPQLGNLQVDYFLGVNTSYTFDLTQFLRVIIPDNTYDLTKRGLLFIPPSPQSEVNFARTVIGNRNNLNYRATLELYYIGLN